MLESGTVDAMRLRGRCGKTADKKLCTGDPLDDEHRLGAQRATKLAAWRRLWRWRDLTLTGANARVRHNCSIRRASGFVQTR